MQRQAGQNRGGGHPVSRLSDCCVKALVDSAVDPPEELRRRAEDGTLNWNDLYDLDFSDVDPVAIVQNLGCRVEKAMGIFPNVPRLILPE